MIRAIVNGLYQLWGTNSQGECVNMGVREEKPMFRMCVKSLNSIREECPTTSFTPWERPETLLEEKPWRLKTSGNLALNGVLEHMITSVGGEEGGIWRNYGGVVLVTEHFSDSYVWNDTPEKKIVMLQHLA